jgi:hypothetical protein
MLYAGQKIKFEKSMDHNPPATPAGKAGGAKKKVKPSVSVYESVRNGEIAMIVSVITEEGPKQRTVLELSDPLASDQTSSKFVLLDALEHVDPECISLAWCITINASQGSQFPMIVAWFHAGYSEECDRFSGRHVWKREHLYVGISRARYRAVVVSPGGEDTLAELASQVSEPLDTTVRADIATHMPIEAYAVQEPPPPSEWKPLAIYDRESLQIMSRKIPCCPLITE